MKAGRVDHYDLRVRLIDNSGNAAPRRLRARRYDRYFLAHQAVEQRRFANVSTTRNRNETGAMCCCFQFYIYPGAAVRALLIESPAIRFLLSGPDRSG